MLSAYETQEYFRFPNREELEKLLEGDPELQQYPEIKFMLQRAADSFCNRELSYKDLIARANAFTKFYFKYEAFSEENQRLYTKVFIETLIRCKNLRSKL